MKSKKEIILINGLPRAGKDTAADYLVEKYNYKKLSFASSMKKIISSTFGITEKQLDTYKNNPYDIKIYVEDTNSGNVLHVTNFRDILRLFGTEGMKPVFGDSVWADVIYKAIEKDDHDKFVISDFRFLCEYQENEELYNLTSVLVNDGRELPLEGHASDVELYQNEFKFNKEIYNSKDESFFDRIDDLMKSKDK